MDEPAQSTPENMNWISARSDLARAAALLGAFVAAIGLGFAMAAVLRPGSDLVVVLGVAGFVLALTTGYSIWTSYVIGMFTRGLFGGVVRGLFQFFLSKDKAGLDGAAASLREAVTDKARLQDMLAKIRAKTSVFRTAGLVSGVMTGLIVGLVGTRLGLIGALAAYGATGYFYGSALAWLAREGYLPLPEEG